jgi:hypothetical protein
VRRLPDFFHAPQDEMKGFIENRRFTHEWPPFSIRFVSPESPIENRPLPFPLKSP